MGDERIESSSPAYTAIFRDAFPYYLAIGMTAEQFWEQDCNLVKYYNGAARIKRDLANQDAWVQAMYIYEALCDVSPVFHAFAKKGTKPRPFRTEPYPFGLKAEKEREVSREEKNDAKAKAFLEMFALHHNKKFEKREVAENGG